MTTEELNTVADTLSTVYRKRGYILVDDVQSKLDEFGASLVETTQLTRLLEERGCRISDHGNSEDDLSMYDGSYERIPTASVKKLLSYYRMDAKAGIPGLSYTLEEYSEGLLFYSYLRKQLKLSRVTCIQLILTLQETYEMFLPEGEDKSIFDIDSAAYIETIFETLQNRKKYKKIRANHKSALGTYQMFLTQNKHKILAVCVG